MKRFSLSVRMCIFSAFLAFSSTIPSELLLFREDELETVSTKIPMKVEASPSSVTVFNAEQIKKLGITTIAEILQMAPGIYVSSSERYIKRIAVRGIISSYNDKVLLMIDNTPVREIFYQHAFISEYIPIDNIDRIEVIRGPGSALYGANAFSGTINIITKT